MGDGDPQLPCLPTCLPRPRSCSAQGGRAWPALRRGLLGGGREEGWGPAAGALGRRLETRTTGDWGGARPRVGARWGSGAGAPARAQWPWSPAAHPGSRGSVGPTGPGACRTLLLGPQGMPRTVPLAIHASPAAPEGQRRPPTRGSAPCLRAGGPRGSRGAPSRRRPEAREGGRVPSGPWAAAGRGSWGKARPRAWLGPGGQGADEGRLQRQAGAGDPPLPPHSPPTPLERPGRSDVAPSKPTHTPTSQHTHSHQK